MKKFFLMALIGVVSVVFSSFQPHDPGVTKVASTATLVLEEGDGACSFISLSSDGNTLYIGYPPSTYNYNVIRIDWVNWGAMPYYEGTEVPVQSDEFSVTLTSGGEAVAWWHFRIDRN